MSVTLSDEEKRSLEFDKHSTDHLDAAPVSIFFPLISPPLGRKGPPYPEVRSAVANTDDPTMPSSTFRAWVVGLIWAILIPGVNQFFFFRYPSVTITQVCKILFRGVCVFSREPLLN